MNSMKKINAYMQLLLLSVVLLSISCTGDFENMNRNPNEVTDGQMDALNYKIGTKFQSLQGLVVPVQEHMYQFNESLSGGPFGGYIGATVDSWLTKFETFNPSADWRKWPFANVITETYTPWRGIVTGTDDEVAVAFAKLLRVAIMHRVTDSYGPIPYSNLETNESITVKYDKQEEVYMKMFGELDEAIAAFAANTTLPAEAFSRYDRVYGGNIAQWLKYANSLKLRMAMRLSEVKPDVARTKAAEAIAAGVITANADNAAMHAAENRTTLIYNDWGDHRVGADILCYMTGYEDPRLEKMFLPNDKGDYVGIRIGIDVTSKSQAQAKYSNMIVTSSTPYLWINAAEVAFLKAEYELRWGTKDAAKALYEQAIRLSFEDKGAKDADAYIADKTRKPAAIYGSLFYWGTGRGGLCTEECRAGRLPLVAFEVDRVEPEVFDDSVFVTLQIAALDEVQQVAVGHRFAVFAQLPLDRLEKVAGLLLDEVQRRVDDVLKLGDDVVARDFVEFGVEAVFADRSVFVVADDLTHLDDLLQLGDVGVGEVAEDVVADADFERHAEFEDVAERRFVHQQRIDAPLHAAEQRRLAQHHAFLGARDDHAGHLEAAQRFAQHRASDAQ